MLLRQALPLVLSLLCIAHVAPSQNLSSVVSNKTGVPFIRNYTPQEYNAHNQNWAAVQDQRGVMYFGNNDGVLEYNGVSWRIMQTQEKTVRSLAIDKTGTIYVGTFDDIGYLKPDEKSQLQFFSLLPLVDTLHRDLGDVWHTVSTSDGIFFISNKYILRWNGTEMKVWNASTVFYGGWAINDQFYVRQKDIGLMQFQSDSLGIAPGSEPLGQERFLVMLPFPSKGNNTMLIPTRSNGIFLYNGHSIEKFSTEADEFLKENPVYSGTQMSNGLYAFGTVQNGILIIDEKGKTHYHLNKSTGLQNETIYHLFPDNQGGLWAGMHFGISRIETSSPITYFGEREGLEGSALQIVRHDGILYTASSMGVYYLGDISGSNKPSGKFQRVEGVAPQAWALAPFGNTLLAATFEGVYEIQGGSGHMIDSAYAMCLARSGIDTNRFFVGMQSGFKSIYYDKGKWRDEGRTKDIGQEINEIYEAPDGVCWLTTRYNSVLRVDFSKGFTTQAPVIIFDSLAGLPNGERTIAFNSSQGIRFGTSKGIYRFDESRQLFVVDTSLIKGIPKDINIFTVTTGHHGNLWISATGIFGVALLQKDGSYEWDGSPFLRIADIDKYIAYPDPTNENVIWLGCVDRIVRYNGNVEKKNVQPFRTLIRSVVVNEDSLLYGGATLLSESNFTLSHGYKSLRFNFAAPSFDEEEKNEYQYMLKGYDADWSNWTKETYKDYTGLPKGDYIFSVRSRNIYNQVGETATVGFKILPPFYLTWWSYLMYLIILFVIVFAARQAEVKRMRIKHQAELKQVEFEKLKELDHLKSTFFADISHEFRTPLTLILGPIDQLLSSNPTQEETKQYHMMKRNALRLLRLINQLLDLSKLDAGKMKLDLKKEDIIPFFKGMVHSFESLSQSKEIQLAFQSEMENAILPFDRDKMEQVITNLISNAIKFTPKGGQVTIEVMKNADGNSLQIDVKDTGSGISKFQLPHVFDRFYQGDESARSGEPGTGIGLALAKELVELHKGQITVNSHENQGSTFTILLPFKEEKQSSVETTSVPQPIRSSLIEEYAIESSIPFIEAQDLSSENTLLLVEDNPDMRLFIRSTLSGNYRIIEAIDGEDGVAKAFEFIPDIIISDVMMPRKDGLELCALLKTDERTSHIPIILLTAKADIESRLAGLERGADDYLAKPFNREELLIRSRNLLEIRKQLWKRYTSLQEIPPSENKHEQIEDEFLLKIRGLIEDHMSDSDFEIEKLSRLVGMSRSQMFRKTKALTGQSPSLFIRSIRLHRAKALLESTAKNVTEVAYEVGFSAPAYFSDAFTETYGFRPSQVKK